ncbi:MAG: hypothetical protein MRERV_58c010 [Mycoplasmataceae bacterium RV_VA103A]|nr:MAG: hypothetical protein MRERV_58c010 [Mycoplasmataceae bacterium RV_VA103A]
MTTLQEYLNEKYPTREDKEKVEEINSYFISKELKDQGIIEKLDGGELDLREYINLKKIHIKNYYLKTSLTKLEISNCINLIELKCSHNQLTSLDVSNCPKLTVLDCRDNQLISLDLSNNAFLTGFTCSTSQKNKEFCKKITFPVALSLNDFIWKLWENYSGRRGNRIGVSGIEKLTDFSDLDDWVRNYDVSKIGDKEYHKICGEEMKIEIYFPDCSALDNLSNKIIARNLVIANRLTDGIDKEYEEWVTSLGNMAGQCRAMNPKKGFGIEHNIRKR